MVILTLPIAPHSRPPDNDRTFRQPHALELPMTSLASLLMAAFLAVPVPSDAKDDAPAPEPTGPAPRILFVKADADGKVLFTVRRTAANAPNPQGGIGRVGMTIARVELKDVADLAITSPNGTKIE